MAEKTCTKCSVTQPLTEFSPNRSAPDGLQSWCKGCRRTYNREAHKTERGRAAALRTKYGLDEAQFNAMLADCGGKCPVCATAFTRGYRGMHVDHCHATGVVRGLLCADCNNALGFLKDDPGRIAGLLAYLVDRV